MTPPGTSTPEPQDPRTGDEGVAMVMALGLIGIFAVLLLVMLASVVQQVKPTAQARKDIGSVNAAGSGLQAGIANLRRAVDVTGRGSRGLLPCTSSPATPATFRTGGLSSPSPGASLTGSASSQAGRFSYRVDIAYFSEDPTDQSPAWLASHALPCPLTTTPSYAYLQSYGTGANLAGAGGATGNLGNRSQTGVYLFSVPAVNVAGGRLVEFGQNLCVDAGTSPAAGSRPSLQTCQVLGTPQQTWQYRKDLTLFYGGNPALNLCIQGTSGSDSVLARCTGTGDGTTYSSTTPRYQTGQQVQEWSFNDSGHFASAADNGDVTTTCLQPRTASAGAALTVTSCSGSTTSYQAFNPDPAVGAGKAGGNVTGLPGSPTNQFVNFAQFGRCLDVTGQQVTADHLIAYPCKQAPDSTRLTWNQVWTWTAVSGQLGRLSTAPGGTSYCLTAPATGLKVVVTACSTSRTDQQWTATQVTGSASTSYNLVSQSRPQQCLSISLTDVSSFGSSTVVVEPCDGTTKQRWNAPPPLPPAGLNSIAEGSTVR